MDDLDRGVEDGLSGAVRAFEQEWARTVVNEALRRLEGALREEGKARHWLVLQSCLVQHARGMAKPSMKQVASELGFETPARASATLQYARKRLMLKLRQVVAESVSCDVDDELEHIKRALG